MNDMSWKIDPSQNVASIEKELGLHSPKKDIKRGVIIALVFFGGLMGWAALTPLDAGAMAPGIVAVSGSRQLVQHRDGGIVTEIAVTEGQRVQKGDLLIKVSASELVASERSMSSEYLTLVAQRARLRAEQTGASGIATPPEFNGLTGEDRRIADDALRGQRLLFEARRSSIANQRDIYGQRVRQQGAQISAFGSQMKSNRTQRQLIGEELDGMKSLVEKGFVSLNRIRATERSAAELDGNFGALQADVSRSNESISESRMQMLSLDRQMLEDVAGQMRDAELRIAELQPKLASAREMLDLASLRAPATGRVVGLVVNTVGGVVRGGDTLMEIVPENRELVIEAKVQPTDADDLKIGMQTQVRFTALQERNLPVLFGRIRKVSADSFEDERTGEHHFAMEVTVASSELSKITAIRGETGLKAGLPAEVMVPLRKRTALGYLLEPLTQMFWKAGHEH